MPVPALTKSKMLGAIALSVWTTACASGGAPPRPFPMPGAPSAAERPSVPPEIADRVSDEASTAAVIVDTALGLRGTPYRNGGSDPSGFDCSGFTQYVFAQAGTRLPRDTREQFLEGSPVETGAQQPGDLIFFRTIGDSVSHVGIALGDDRFVHAPSSRGVVRIESMTLPYWKRRLVGIRRVVAAPPD